MVRLKAGGVNMTASVPLDQATDIIQNWITEMCKQKAETENNNASPHPQYISFLAVIIKIWNYLIALKSCMVASYLSISFLLSFPPFLFFIEQSNTSGVETKGQYSMEEH